MPPQHECSTLSLFDVLSNSLIRSQTCPYLNISSLLSLAATSKSFRSLMYDTPHVFRYLSLATSKVGISDPEVNKEDAEARNGLQSWCLESVDDYYSRALRNVFKFFQRRNVLQDITTLILDGLSVPAPLLREILCEDSYNVRILSIRGVRNLGDQKLIQLLRYIIRSSRPEGTPKLRGLYYFGVPDSTVKPSISMVRETAPQSITSTMGAMLGAQLNNRSQQALVADSNAWYKPSGQILSPIYETEWVALLRACSGIIAFDAVICRNDTQHATGDPADQRIATVSLGPTGCHKCQSCPEGPAFAGISHISHVPLLAPPPLHSSNIKVAQNPRRNHSDIPPFFARCRKCLENRWCERCNVWWCESCYTIPKGGSTKSVGLNGIQSGEAGVKESIKVHLGLCVHGCLVEEMYSGAGEGGMWG